MNSERDDQSGRSGQQQSGEWAQGRQGAEQAQGQADYGSPRDGSENSAFFGQGGGNEGEGMSKEEWLRQNPEGVYDPDQGSGGGMSKEEWLRQNPDGAFDPEQAPGEGMSKEEWLRQNQGEEQDSGTSGGGRY